MPSWRRSPPAPRSPPWCWCCKPPLDFQPSPSGEGPVGRDLRREFGVRGARPSLPRSGTDYGEKKMEEPRYLFLAALFSFGILHFAVRAIATLRAHIKPNSAAETTAAHR